MREWNNPSVKSPAEGELVEIRIPGGRRIKNVQFADGRFWKARKAQGGQAYTVEEWRAIETQAEVPKVRAEKPNEDNI